MAPGKKGIEDEKNAAVLQDFNYNLTYFSKLRMHKGRIKTIKWQMKKRK